MGRMGYIGRVVWKCSGVCRVCSVEKTRVESLGLYPFRFPLNPSTRRNVVCHEMPVCLPGFCVLQHGPRPQIPTPEPSFSSKPDSDATPCSKHPHTHTHLRADTHPHTHTLSCGDTTFALSGDLQASALFAEFNQRTDTRAPQDSTPVSIRSADISHGELFSP